MEIITFGAIAVTPDSIRKVSNLRREFYDSFAAAMCVPVRISGSSYNGNALIASWIDDRQELNYVNIYAYIAPDDLLNQRPFVLRLAINKGAGDLAIARRRPPCQGLNQRWSFELTVLPEEILDFLPWVVSLVKAKAKGILSLAQEAPHPINLDISSLLLANKAWTKASYMATPTVGYINLATKEMT